MIELIQTGQAGKNGLLLDMHRLRARVFKETLQWDVHVNDAGLEVDQFDLPETVYLLALNNQGSVIGNWRMLPASGPTMIRDIWPQYLETLPLPSDDDIWEVSRFAIHSTNEDPEEAQKETQIALGEMFCALTEVCMAVRIREIFTLYDNRIARVIERIDCKPYKTSTQLPINGIPCQTGAFRTDNAMLQRLRAATGIGRSLIEQIELPPALQHRINRKETQKESVDA